MQDLVYFLQHVILGEAGRQAEVCLDAALALQPVALGAALHHPDLDREALCDIGQSQPGLPALTAMQKSGNMRRDTVHGLHIRHGTQQHVRQEGNTLLESMATPLNA